MMSATYVLGFAAQIMLSSPIAEKSGCSGYHNATTIVLRNPGATASEPYKSNIMVIEEHIGPLWLCTAAP
jgi:hypothetical protein